MASAVAMMAAAGGPVLNGADAAGLKEAAGMYEQLRAEWNRKNLSLSKCGDLLGRLKGPLLLLVEPFVSLLLTPCLGLPEPWLATSFPIMAGCSQTWEQAERPQTNQRRAKGLPNLRTSPIRLKGHRQLKNTGPFAGITLFLLPPWRSFQ